MLANHVARPESREPPDQGPHALRPDFPRPPGYTGPKRTLACKHEPRDQKIRWCRFGAKGGSLHASLHGNPGGPGCRASHSVCHCKKKGEYSDICISNTSNGLPHIPFCFLMFSMTVHEARYASHGDRQSAAWATTVLVAGSTHARVASRSTSNGKVGVGAGARGRTGRTQALNRDHTLTPCRCGVGCTP